MWWLVLIAIALFIVNFPWLSAALVAVCVASCVALVVAAWLRQWWVDRRDGLA